MRTYNVPFSTKGEEKLAFNLGMKECVWLGCGIVVAVMAFSTPMFFGVTMPKLLYFLPLAIPPLGASAFVAFKKVKQFDNHVKIDESLWHKWRFKKRIHNFIMYRK